MSVKMLVIATGFNCADMVRKCYDSIMAQTYGEFDAILMDDGSTDGTGEELKKIANSDPRVRIFLSGGNMGAAFRRWQAITELSDADEHTVICLLGMDDELKPDALAIVARKYRYHGCWMTYGNWVDNHGKMLPEGFLHFTDSVHINRSYRQDVFRSTALNTFKKFLFDRMTEEDFKYKGEWIRATTESNLMISCLEMCGKEKVAVIEDPIYLYNKRADNTVNRMGREYQRAIYLDMQSRKKRDTIRYEGKQE